MLVGFPAAALGAALLCLLVPGHQKCVIEFYTKRRYYCFNPLQFSIRHTFWE